MESSQQKEQRYPQLAQPNYQPQQAEYYTQDPNTGAQQIYYINPPVQYQQAPIQYVTVVQNQPRQSNINPNCRRCHGAGFNSKGKPCRECCIAAGVCYKCGGSGMSRKGRPCNNCAYHINAGVCPTCTIKKALSGKNNKPCLICKTYQRIKF